MRREIYVIFAGLLALSALAAPARAGDVSYPVVPGVVDRDTTPEDRATFLRVLKVMEKTCPDWLKDIDWDGVARNFVQGAPPPKAAPTFLQISYHRPGAGWGADETIFGALGWSTSISIYISPPNGPAFAFLVGAGKRTGIASNTSKDRGFWTCRLNEIHGRYTFREVPELGFLKALK